MPPTFIALAYVVVEVVHLAKRVGVLKKVSHLVNPGMALKCPHSCDVYLASMCRWDFP